MKTNVFSVIAALAVMISVASCGCRQKPSGETTPASNVVEITDSDADAGNVPADDWDSVLDDYEKYVDKYISMYKKAMGGDLGALGAYAELLESAEKMSEKLSRAEADMTSAQMNRYLSITQKMTAAAASVLDE